MAEQQRDKQRPDQKRKLAVNDANYLAAIRLFTLRIEQLAMVMYRSDLTKDRTNFHFISEPLAACITTLLENRKYFTHPKADKGRLNPCQDPDQVCDDGLCHPMGEESQCSRKKGSASSVGQRP
jgi:hypothetical protein